MPTKVTGEGEVVLAQRHVGEHAVHEARGCIARAAAGAGRAGGAAFAREGHQVLVLAVLADDAGEAVGEHAAFEIGAKLSLHVAGEPEAVGRLLPGALEHRL